MKHKTELVWNACCCQLKSFIQKRVSDSMLAEDILQEVFLKAHMKIDTVQDETKICSWLYQITRNTIIDYYRKKKENHLDIDSIQYNDENEEDDNPREISFDDSATLISDDGKEITVAQEIASGLREMIESLPPKYAEALVLVEFHGISQIELAKRLGISVSGAKSRVQRGRQMLKDILMQCCHFEFDRYGTIIGSHPITCCCCNS